MLILGATVRNISSTVQQIVDHLISEFSHLGSSFSIHIVESDSSDDSEQLLKNLALLYPNHLYTTHLGRLRNLIPHRIDRICYCRNILVGSINNFVSNTIDDSQPFYLFFDSDLSFVRSIQYPIIAKLVDFLVSRQDIDALFPFSIPFYYDILALRASSWLDTDPWTYFAQLVISGQYIEAYHYIQRLQRPLPSTSVLIPVESAFGGLALYRNLPKKSHPYASPKRLHGRTCEHISFNRHFDKLYIDPSWNIPAPYEHLICYNWRLKLLCRLSRILHYNLVPLSY